MYPSKTHTHIDIHATHAHTHAHTNAHIKVDFVVDDGYYYFRGASLLLTLLMCVGAWYVSVESAYITLVHLTMLTGCVLANKVDCWHFAAMAAVVILTGLHRGFTVGDISVYAAVPLAIVYGLEELLESYAEKLDESKHPLLVELLEARILSDFPALYWTLHGHPIAGLVDPL